MDEAGNIQNMFTELNRQKMIADGFDLPYLRHAFRAGIGLLSAYKSGLTPEENGQRLQNVYTDLYRCNLSFISLNGVCIHESQARMKSENCIVFNDVGDSDFLSLMLALKKKHQLDAVALRTVAADHLLLYRGRDDIQVVGEYTFDTIIAAIELLNDCRFEFRDIQSPYQTSQEESFGFSRNVNPCKYRRTIISGGLG